MLLNEGDLQLLNSIKDLKLGFNDAVNYKRRENKDVFNRIFIKNEKLEKLMNPSTYFLLGDKGTGKTAYAVWLNNNEYKNTSSILNDIRETEYLKFVAMKKENNLNLSDYTNIWRVILLLLMSKQIYNTEGQENLLNKFWKFKAINKAIDQYYDGAFKAEILSAIEFVSDSSKSAKLLAKNFELLGTNNDSKSFTESKYQVNLLYIQRKFEDAIHSLKLKKNHVVFIDGVDLRPTGIKYEEYLECVKGLANAVWSINNDFFSSINDSKGRLKVVILLRPDIFNAIGLQNSNNRIRDNAVLLDWRIPYSHFKNSELFKLPNRLLSIDQKNKLDDINSYWDNYFPYTVRSNKNNNEHSFISFLRFSYFRPRDIVTMLCILQELHINNGYERNFFTQQDFEDSHFRRLYSEYLLGEAKDHLSFYYSDTDYKNFLKFFEFLRGKFSFSFDDYKHAYDEFVSFLAREKEHIPDFLETEIKFLQFLYELNIIFCVEESTDGKTFVFWCFRDRTVSNIAPRVKTKCKYEIFYGLGKALNMGKQFIE